MWQDQSLRSFGQNIQRLIRGEDLSQQESYTMFQKVLLNQQPELQQGAFLAALAAKGETPAEIAGAWQAIVELDTASVEKPLDPPLVENSGTGMDRLKTFNISSAAAVVAAAGGVRLARHGARGLTSSCGTVDLLEALGVHMECEIATVTKSIEQVGIGLFNGTSPKVHPKALFRILSQIRFGSTLNIAASLASPCRPTHALRGVYKPELLEKVPAVMKAIGYQRAMVVHGFNQERDAGMDELSNVGPNLVNEFFPDGSEQSYLLTPEEVGLKCRTYSDIAAIGNVTMEAVRFLKIIGGNGHPACEDIVCLNAGALFKLIDVVHDIAAGIDHARQLIHSGQALGKLCQWVQCQHEEPAQGCRQLLQIAVQANLKNNVEACL